MNHRLRALMLSLLLAPATVLAQQTAERSSAYEVDTGDSWVDAQLRDINHYAERYPDAFLDEVSRYADVPRGYISALFTTHGWQAGDIYFACFWAKASGQTCRDSVRAFSQTRRAAGRRWSSACPPSRTICTTGLCAMPSWPATSTGTGRSRWMPP